MVPFLLPLSKREMRPLVVWWQFFATWTLSLDKRVQRIAKKRVVVCGGLCSCELWMNHYQHPSFIHSLFIIISQTCHCLCVMMSSFFMSHEFISADECQEMWKRDWGTVGRYQIKSNWKFPSLSLSCFVFWESQRTVGSLCYSRSPFFEGR